MASLIYNSFIADALVGSVDCDTDTFKMMLVTSSYTADKDHDRRNDVTNEITGTGYTAGGAATTLTVSTDTVSDKVEITFANTSWATATFTARGAVIYKSRGGASSADELVCYLDFGSDKSPSAETFTVQCGVPLTIQN